MQSPNIVYFLKKKVNQYMAGIPNDDDYDRKPMMPPPPPFIPYFDEKKFDMMPPPNLNELNPNNFMWHTD